MIFNLKKSSIWLALKSEKLFFLRYFRILFLLSSFFCFFLFFFGFLSDFLEERLLGIILAIFLLSFPLFCFLSSFEFFLDSLKKPKRKKTDNIADLLSFSTAKVIYRAQKSSSGYLLLSVIQNIPEINFIFQRMLLDINSFKKTLLKKHLGDGVEFKKVILKSLEISQKRNHQEITIGDFILSLAKNDLFFKNTLVNLDMKKDDFLNIVNWMEDVFSEKPKFWEEKSLRKKGNLGKEWSSGYSVALDKYSIDISHRFKNNILEFFGHEKQLTEIENILSKTENNNVLMVGDSGTSRKSIIENLAQKTFLGESVDLLNYKRVVELDLNLLSAQIKEEEELEFTLNKIFQETIRAGNIILVINNFHDYVSQSSFLGGIDISGIIASYLKYSQFQIIVITDYEGLHRKLSNKSGLLSFFEKVEIPPKSGKDALKILLSQVGFFERKHKAFVSFQSLKQIIEMTEKYLPALPFPEKAVAVLDEVFVAYAKEKIILPKHVSKIITRKTEIPVGDLEEKEKEILLNLENLIHERLINQDQAVKNISDSLKRARSQISTKVGPMGTFLFLGPTGVGKTETAKSLAQIYFGSEEKMIRMDMSEFQEVSDISRLIGSEKEPGLLTTKVRENPFSIVLLDELEKANLNILNLFLQVLDEGYLNDGYGQKVDFKNTIIIATSNAGYQIILDAIKKEINWDKIKEKIFDFIFKEGIFKPEFVNRFDSVVVFKPLSKENLVDIAGLLLNKIAKNLKEKGIKLIIEDGLKEKIVELSYNPMFGAREMKRVIQDKVENNLASALIKGDLSKGHMVKINLTDFSLIINPN